jgi:hypothetical protein
MSACARPRRPRGRRARFAQAAVLLGACSLSRGAFAQLGDNGTPIQTNDYAIDLFQGPVIASTRVMGLGGAYVAVAEFTEGTTQNPAAPAVRTAYSFDHIDYDIGLGLTIPATLTSSDFFNTGKGKTFIPSTSQQGFIAGEIAANLQFGRWGIGASLRAQRYSLTRAESDDQLESRFASPDIQLARAFLDGQLVLGAGLRGGGLSVVNTNAERDSDATLFESAGGTLQAGGLWRPNDTSYRIGAAVRGPIRTDVDETDEQVLFPGTSDELFLPNSVEMPWEIAAGFAYQFGRLFNPRWYDPSVLVERTERYVLWRRADRDRRRERLYRTAESAGGDVSGAKTAIDAMLRAEEMTDEASLARAREETRARLEQRYQELKRFYLLISTALIVNGPTPDAVGVESFLERTVNRSGQNVTFSPRLGVETEIWPRWFVLRGGTYLEPTRFGESNPDGARWHGTVGGDLRLGGWNVFGAWPEKYIWRLRGALDVSRRYLGWGVAIGGWY